MSTVRFSINVNYLSVEDPGLMADFVIDVNTTYLVGVDDPAKVIHDNAADFYDAILNFFETHGYSGQSFDYAPASMTVAVAETVLPEVP
jgi:hypothetical protein